MSDSEPSPAPARFALTLRQRRLRVATAVLLVFIAVMVGFGMTHPFFRSTGSLQVQQRAKEAIAARRAGLPVSPAAERARRVVRARLLAIYFYWTTCFLFVLCLPVFAWLDVRETLRQTLIARRDMWREIAEESRRRRQS
jgi:hypothetical protein